MKKILIITVLLLFAIGFAQDTAKQDAPKTVPIKQYTDLVVEYKNLEQISDSYMKRMVQAQDANTLLRQLLSNLSSDLIKLELAPVDSVLKVYGAGDLADPRSQMATCAGSVSSSPTRRAVEPE